MCDEVDLTQETTFVVIYTGEAAADDLDHPGA